ncbi:MAG: NADPH:quinone oxidoreductase [Phycisphaerae bacterium]
MKAFQIQNAFGFDSLRLVDLPAPQPGPGQVLLRMRALSLNFRDLMVVKGIYNPHIPLPRIPVSDGVGEVVEVGPGASRVRVGQRVAGIFMPGWVEGEPDAAKGQTDLGGTIDGLAAEYVVLHERGVVEVPEHLSDEAAASLPCAAVTAWNALVNSGRLTAGESVLILGTGGVALFALQFAKLHGARVIITSSSDDKLARARDLGADEGINYTTTPGWEHRVLELTGGRGVDHVIELGGAGTLGQSLQSVRIGGHVALIGVLTGAGQANPLPVLMRSIRLQGIFVGSRVMFEAMNRAIALHKLEPVVDRVFPFDELPQALRYMEQGKHFGKIGLRF